MCQALTDSTGGVGAGMLVDQLDVESEAEAAARNGLSRGPFHVFSVCAAISEAESSRADTWFRYMNLPQQMTRQLQILPGSRSTWPQLVMTP